MKRTEEPAMSDFEIKTDEYSLWSNDGILGAEYFPYDSTDSLMHFLHEVFVYLSFEGLEEVVGSMEIQGVSIPDITARCIREIEMCVHFDPTIIMCAKDRFRNIRFVNDITYEPKFGISKGVFRHLIRAGREMPFSELGTQIRAELVTGLAGCTTAKDIVDVFSFQTLAYNSPMLKYLLSQKMTSHGKI